MTQEDIIRMARESRLYLDGENQQQPMYVLQPEELIRFAALVAAAEREACANDWQALHGYDKHGVAAVIRARGQA